MVGGWVGGWVEGHKRGFKDGLQQSKIYFCVGTGLVEDSNSKEYLRKTKQAFIRII